MTTHETFRPFFDLMIEEMQRHDPEFGDSWLNQDKVAYDVVDDEVMYVSMEEHLDNLLLKATDEYDRTKESSQLEDIANICAMRRLRGIIKELEEEAMARLQAEQDELVGESEALLDAEDKARWEEREKEIPESGRGAN